MKKISIITIVYNGVDFIRGTIESIISQDYFQLEYIIIDGGSNDGTMDIVREYSYKIAVMISEEDSGIYDAMNKGLSYATGDYVLFINCGDRLSANNILTEILSKESGESDVIYGDTLITDQSGNVLHYRRHRPPEKLSWRDYKRGMLVCHQSFVAKKSLCSNYDCSYKYASDYEWCLNVLKKSKVVRNSNCVISLFMDGGVTKNNIAKGLKERYKIMCNYYGWFSATCSNISLGVKFAWWKLWHKWF